MSFLDIYVGSSTVEKIDSFCIKEKEICFDSDHGFLLLPYGNINLTIEKQGFLSKTFNLDIEHDYVYQTIKLDKIKNTNNLIVDSMVS